MADEQSEKEHEVPPVEPPPRPPANAARIERLEHDLARMQKRREHASEVLASLDESVAQLQAALAAERGEE